MNSIAQLVGTICLLLMFMLSGIHKIFNYGSTVQGLTTKAPYWPLPQLSIGAAIVLELLCPAAILYSMVSGSDPMKISKMSMIMLLIFTVVVTLIYHPFRKNGTYITNIPFFSNVSLIGGLVLLLAYTDTCDNKAP